MTYVLVLLGLLLLPRASLAAPPDLSGFQWVQRPGAQVPMSVVLHDDTGQEVRLGDFARRLPLVLAFGYYHCPNLCGLARNVLLTAIADGNLLAGRDYALAVVSIDPSETPADAHIAKRADEAAVALPGEPGSRAYLTGDQNALAALTEAVGYEGRFNTALKQFVHPTGLVVVTPAGRVSSYLLGLGFRSGDLRVALAQASQGTVQAAAVPVLLLCFHYDATTGRYTLSILKLLKLAAGLTVITVGGLGLLLFRREKQA